MIQPGGTRGLSESVAGHPLDALWIIGLMPWKSERLILWRSSMEKPRSLSESLWMPSGSSAGCRLMPSNAVKIGTGHPLDAL